MAAANCPTANGTPMQEGAKARGPSANTNAPVAT